MNLHKYSLPLFIAFFTFLQLDGKGQNYIDNLDSYNDNIKTIAIMPFKLFVGRNGHLSDTSAEMEKEATTKKAYLLQEKLCVWMSENTKPATVTFQDVAHTDSLLRKTKLGFDALWGLNEAALCRYLGVDAVAYCSIKMSNPNYDFGNELGKGIVGAMVQNATGVSSLYNSSMNTTTYSMKIIDNSGQEVWKYTKEERGYSTNNSVDALRPSFIGNITHKLPFIILHPKHGIK